MKILKKLLLIHWHYFDFQTVEFDQLNFLTGQNASGKSTLIDALQLVLLGDTSGSYFNKSASGRTNRSLKGYLLGELGDDEQSGFRYLRNGRFTSYIALEFFDDDKNKNFTAGICFDVHSESDIPRLFFLYDGPLDQAGFLRNRVPMDIPTLRSFFKQTYPGHFETTDTGRDFRTKLYGKLGGLRERFGTLLKKAVSFNPDVDLQKFITEFVCDTQQPVDVTHMQENIRSYKRLEEESVILRQRTARLEEIVNTYQDFSTQRQNEQLYSYLIDRALAEMKGEAVIEAEVKLRELCRQLEDWKLEEAAATEELAALRDARDELVVEQRGDSSALALERLNQEILAGQAAIQSAQLQYREAVSALADLRRFWQERTTVLIDHLDKAEPELFSPLIASRLTDCLTTGRSFRAELERFQALPEDALSRLTQAELDQLASRAGQLQRNSHSLLSRLEDLQAEASQRAGELRREQQSLEQGVYPFPRDAVDLKEAIRSRLSASSGRPVDVRIVAETADIRDERWRNAIEGYLHTQKYYLLVPPEQFNEAAQVYDEIRQAQKIYGTGIVDIAKIIRLKMERRPGSLAEELETTDPLALVFLDYTLGRVQKCEAVDQLRQFNTAITPQGMLYTNYVVRALHPDRWSRPAIGQGAIQRRLEALQAEMADLKHFQAQCQGLHAGLKSASELQPLGPQEIKSHLQASETYRKLPELQEAVRELTLAKSRIDTTRLDALVRRIGELDGAIRKTDDLIRELDKQSGKAEAQCDALKTERIPLLKSELDDQAARVELLYPEKWVEATGGIRYQKELALRGQAFRIAEAFPREQSKARNAREQTWDQLVEYRRAYNDRYKMGFDIKAGENSVYDDAWLELTENKLPEFLSRIQDAKAKAFEQFQEDFLSRLQNNISNARRQIDDLNNAIRGASFGEDSYRFRMVPRPEYKRFYDMIVDEMLTQGYNLLSESFNAKYQDEINDLFAIITHSDGTLGSTNQEYEKRVAEFTDYRTYLTFDLEVESRDGTTQRLSKTLGKKSGGETQTPFYIAVLASFAQLYRTGKDKSYPTARLIIFDEAFSKMDGERIIRSIELLRRFHFQVILSAPPDKVGDIATLVDRNLCVYRKGIQTTVQSFSPKHAEVVYEEFI